MRLVINGFGRIGRAAFKIALEKGIEIVSINDLTSNEILADLLKHDSVYGVYGKNIGFDDNNLIVGDKRVKSFSEKDPGKLPWKELEVDVVLECTGVFRTKEKAQAHINAGAKKVIISAPAKDDITKTFVFGVNESEYENDLVISNASCTTNCIAPVTKILKESFGIEKAMLNTVHAYTADQNLVDGPHKDPRRGRAATENIVPTTTGAAKATCQVIPGLKGSFDGMATRVPVPCGSLSDLVYLLEKDVSVEEINNVLNKASKKENLKGIIRCSSDPLVSTDIVGDSHSAIIDLEMTKVVDGNLVKVIAWYDNEWGYSNRLVEMAELISS